MIKYLLVLSTIILASISHGQVKINRYAEGRVSSKGITGKINLNKEVNVPEIDLSQVYKKWQGQGRRQKFAEPVAVDINPLAIGQWENQDSISVIRLQIVASKPFRLPFILTS